jgi:large subunit ribosomal protein L33
MAKKSEARVTINMACTVCQNRNYTSSKNKRNDTQRLELNKYCSHCRKETLHRETK